MRFRIKRSQTVGFQPLNWPQRILLAATGIAMLGLSALLFLLMLPLLAVGVGKLLQGRNNTKASLSDTQDYIDAEYSEEKPSNKVTGL
jgi:hypothetical protein